MCCAVTTQLRVLATKENQREKHKSHLTYLFVIGGCLGIVSYVTLQFFLNEKKDHSFSGMTMVRTTSDTNCQ
jgi:hypothetical protein